MLHFTLLSFRGRGELITIFHIRGHSIENNHHSCHTRRYDYVPCHMLFLTVTRVVALLTCCVLSLRRPSVPVNLHKWTARAEDAERNRVYHRKTCSRAAFWRQKWIYSFSDWSWLLGTCWTELLLAGGHVRSVSWGGGWICHRCSAKRFTTNAVMTFPPK